MNTHITKQSSAPQVHLPLQTEHVDPAAYKALPNARMRPPSRWPVSVSIISSLIGFVLLITSVFCVIEPAHWLVPVLCFAIAAAHTCLARFIAVVTATTQTILEQRQ